MRAVLLEVPDELVEERRRRGGDRRDEVWDGELHMVPPATGPHQRLSGDLYYYLRARAERLGLVSHFETGLYRSERDYRVPDLLFCRPDQISQRGADGAQLVVELRSPGDESYAKLPFYAALGVREALVVHPGDRSVELFRLADGALQRVDADAAGVVHIEVLGVDVASRRGVLHLTWDGGSATA